MLHAHEIKTEKNSGTEKQTTHIISMDLSSVKHQNLYRTFIINGGRLLLQLCTRVRAGIR